MSKFTKDDIGRTVIVGIPNQSWSDEGFKIHMGVCKVVDVALDGSKLKIKRPGLVPEEQLSSSVFINAADFWSNMVEAKIPQSALTDLVACLSNTADWCYRLEVAKLPPMDAYGDIHCLGSVIKYQDPIPETIRIPKVRSELTAVFAKHCGSQYGSNYPDNWGCCINCGSNDTYFEYSNNDDAHDGGEYIEGYHCESCGCYYLEVYTVTKKKRSLEVNNA